MKFWGARGSIPTPGPEMARHGGNTSCVELTLSDGSEVILDAGTGIGDARRERSDRRRPRPPAAHPPPPRPHPGPDVFRAAVRPDRRGQRPRARSRSAAPLLHRLARYISAPLAPIEIRELPADISFHDVGTGGWQFGPARDRGGVREPPRPDARLPDHRRRQDRRVHPRPRAGAGPGPGPLVARVDLRHGARPRRGPAHPRRPVHGRGVLAADRLGPFARSRTRVEFARRAGAHSLALFHHDPLHDDTAVDVLSATARSLSNGTFDRVEAAREGEVLDL